MALYLSREQVANTLLKIANPHHQFMAYMDARIDDYFVDVQATQMHEVMHHRPHQPAY